MTQVVIDDIIPRTQLISAAGQTVFNTNFTADEATDIDVYARADGAEPDDTTQLVNPIDYTVTFIGGSETVRVTFLVGRVLNDVITIVRNTPSTRTNLYINTNFVPSMLNQDFGILTLVDQQSQMYDTVVNPGYNVSATIEPDSVLGGGDVLLPILPAGNVWRKNDADTEIEAVELPASGAAPKNGSYVTIEDETSSLPESFPLANIGSGFMVNNPSADDILIRTQTGTTNQIDIVNGDGLSGNPTYSFSDNAIFPGVEGLGIIRGDTADRPAIPGVNTFFRFNTDSNLLEFWNGSSWKQLESEPMLNLFPFIVGQNGTYLTIQDAIDAASPLATATTPQVVLINPGIYVEDLVLAPFVHLSSFGGASGDSVIIQGNAIFTPPNPGDVFGCNAITFDAASTGAPAISIQGSNACTVGITTSRLRATLGTCLENLNVNAAINMSDTKTFASAGSKVCNVIGGQVRLNGCFNTAVDTASTLSGSTNYALLGCFDTNSYVVTGGSTLSISSSVVISIANLSTFSLDGTSLGVCLFSSVVSNAASGFYVEGSGTAIIGGINTVTGSASTVDPGITIISPGTQFGSIELLNEPLNISSGGTGVNAVTTTPTPSAWAGWNAQSNMHANNFINGFTTIITSASPVTLTVASPYINEFTGTIAQTVILPVTSTLITGQSFWIINNSTAVVTVQSSGLNTISSLAADTSAIFTCILTSGTTATSWNSSYAEMVTPVPISRGGTGKTSFVGYAPIFGGTGTTQPLQSVALGAAGTVIQSNGAATLPIFSTATYPSTATVSGIMYASAANVFGQITTANSAILRTDSTGVPGYSATMTNGQVLIGSTGGTPTPAILTAGPGISISNAAASITISGTGSGIGWTEVTGAALPLTADGGFVANFGTLVTLTLPSTAAFGTAISIIGKGAGGWKIAQNNNQSIQIGSVSTTVGVGGSVSSTNRFDSINLICTTANLVWTVLGGPQSSGLTYV